MSVAILRQVGGDVCGRNLVGVVNEAQGCVCPRAAGEWCDYYVRARER